MELEKQFVIPTASRAKVSNKLSYPIGAERISVALAAIPQLAELRVRFCSGFEAHLRGGHYEFLRVEYRNSARALEEWPIRTLFDRPEQSRWEVVVQPVPRIVRHRVKQYIEAFALTEIAQWFIERKELIQRGGDILAYFYEEESDDFAARHATRLEPLRGLSRRLQTEL